MRETPAPASTLDIPKNHSLLEGVVSGIASYGNCFGVPNLGGETKFEPCYSGNPLVNAFALGLVRKDQIFYARAAGETVLGGPYHITATLSAGAGVLDNYIITNDGGDFTITLKAASVTPNAASKTYGGADPVLTGTLTGFLMADGVTAT